MKKKLWNSYCLLAISLAVPSISRAADMGTAFTYQGSLEKPAGTPLTDTCDMRFGLWDSATSGAQKGTSPQTVSAVSVNGGVFTSTIDFGGSAIDGTARWLEIEVKCGGDASFVLLSPRTSLAPAPHALALPGLFTQQNGTSPNIIGGYSGNTVGADFIAVTIAGGGAFALINSATGDAATVGGGLGNVVSNEGSTIGGGEGNKAIFEGSTVAGGVSNQALNNYATAVGGTRNTASGVDSTVGGGSRNVAGKACVGGINDRVACQSDLDCSGGMCSTATADASTVGGGLNNDATGQGSTVGGGDFNKASGDDSTISGGAGNSAVGTWATIAGGLYNSASGSYSAIGGGGPSDPNVNPTTTSNRVTDDYGTIGGGGNNQAGDTDVDTTNHPCATVGGGRSNTASAAYATIGGGGESSPGTPSTGNRVTDDYGTIGGGGNNQAGDDAGTTADHFYATVGGGQQNNATGTRSTISGGWFNNATGDRSTVAGGYSNNATGAYSTVCGGNQNRASGTGSTAAGEGSRAGGDDSLAVGHLAIVRDPAASGDANGDEGTFVWADSSVLAFFTSTGPNQFDVRANGGIYLGTAGPVSIPAGRFVNTSTGAYLTTGGTWTNSSDRNAKENIRSVDTTEVLQKVAGLPISQWNYKTEGWDTRHIGPMAQDFHAAFATGDSDKSIATIDADGVALAAIQGLYETAQEKDCEVSELRDHNNREVEEIKSEIADLKAVVAKLAQQQREGGR